MIKKTNSAAKRFLALVSAGILLGTAGGRYGLQE